MIRHAQRWRNGRQHWRSVGGTTFDPARYVVVDLDDRQAKAWTLAHHYSSTWPAVRLRTGLFDLRTASVEPALVGVVAFGVPMSDKVLTGPFPALTPHYESIELSRLCLLDSVPANGESWFCARSFALAAEHGIRGLVAFSDPVERWRLGPARYRELIKPGHVGIVYQALNFAYLGRSTAGTLTVLPDATVLTARAQAKVTSGERGARGVIYRLVRHGATPPQPGTDPRQWLREALRTVGSRRIWHPGNHRYALRIGRNRGERTRTAIGLAPAATPSRPDSSGCRAPRRVAIHHPRASNRSVARAEPRPRRRPRPDTHWR